MFKRSDIDFRVIVLPRQSGFTLLELLVVIVIIVTAAAVVAPSLGPRAQQAQLDSGAARLDALVRHARTRAVIERREVVLVPSADGRRIHLTYPDVEAEVRTPPLDLGETLRLRVARTQSADGQAGIVFHADGTADSVDILISSHAGVRRMVLEPARGILVLAES